MATIYQQITRAIFGQHRLLLALAGIKPRGTISCDKCGFSGFEDDFAWFGGDGETPYRVECPCGNIVEEG